MANFDNQATKQIQAEQGEAYANGLQAGYDANPNHLPEWYFSTTFGRATPHMRGYFVGRQLRLEELAEQKKE